MKKFLKRIVLGVVLALPWIGAASAQQVNVYCNTGASGPSGWQADSPSNPCPVVIAPSSITGLTPSSSSVLAKNQVIKAAPGNLYSLDVSADATLSAAAWWIMIYNLTAAPVDGTVTPAKCYAMPAGVPSYSAAWNVPVYFSTGIVIGVSTTGCFTKTESTHAFISGDAQ